MKIKRITERDLKDFVTLWNQDFELLTSSQFQMTLKKAKEGFEKKMFDYFGIYGEKEKLLGFLLLQAKGEIIWLKHILVDQNFRRKGRGQVLLKKAVEKAKKEGKKLKTEIIKQNTMAKRFFIKNGFKITDFDKEENQYILEKVTNFV